MSTDTQKLDGIAFLAFPEQADLLLSELKNRFGFEDLPDERYGELLYFADKQRFLEQSAGEYPYWARTVMTEPFI